MTDLDRLRQLTADGDRQAARELLIVARRHGEPAVAVDAARVLGDAPALTELALEAWAAGAGQRCERAASGLGLALTPPAQRRIDTVLAGANGSRRVRLMARAGVLEAMRAALADPHGVAITTGGESDFGTNSWTTLCLAVAWPRDRRIVVGIGVSGAKKPSPGRVWQDLSPWYRDDLERNLERARGWADKSGKGHVERVIVDIVPQDQRARVRSAQAPRRPAGEPEAEQRLAHLRELLARPDELSWTALRELLEQWPADDEREAIVEQAEAALERWPDSLRVGDMTWSKRILDGKNPRPWDRLVRCASLSGIGQPNLERAAALANAPGAAGLTELVVHGPYDAAEDATALIDALCDGPLAPTLRALYLEAKLDIEPLARLLDSPHMAALERLTLRRFGGFGPRPPEAGEQLARYALPGVRALTLRDATLLPGSLAALGRAPALASVRELDLSRCINVTAAGLAELLASEHLTGLERLVLRSLRLFSTGVVGALVDAADRLTTLRELDLTGTARIASGELRALLGSPLIASLETLALGSTHEAVDDEALVALARNPGLSGLRRLDLTAAAIGAEGLEALMASPHLDALESLDLTATKTGMRGARALAGWPGLAGLRELELTSAKIGGTRGKNLIAEARSAAGVADA